MNSSRSSALKKVFIQDPSQMDVGIFLPSDVCPSVPLQEVNREIDVMRKFRHPNILPLVDSSIVPSKRKRDEREVLLKCI